MSSDSPKPPALSVEIPSTSNSIASSVTSSPAGILDDRSSISSLPAHHSVTFAPLPKLGPRKRRSAVPLGVASRGELMRRRRGYTNPTPTCQTANPMWTDEEVAEHHQRLQTAAEERMRREEEAGEDPFVMLGKMVKVASKHIWRKVSQKDLSKKMKRDEFTGAEPVLEVKNKQEPESPQTGQGDISPTAEPRRILATISSNEESGQIEHDDDDHLSEVSQTETIVEGHTKYSWVKGQREELERSTSM